MVTVLQIENAYYPVLAAFGVPANLMTIVILSRGNCDLSKCISLYMAAMAAADLLVMIFNVIIYRVISFHFPYSFLSYTAVCKFILYLIPATLDLSVWFTVSFTFDRFVAICCRNFKTKYSTKKMATMVLTIVSVVIYFENIPFWFAYEPERIIHNIAWGCLSSVVFYSSPAGVAYSWLKSIFVAWLPFCLILLFNCLTIRRILVASRARRALRGHHREKQSDLEIKNRRKSITLLFGVSGSFLLFWLTAVVSFLTTRLPNTAHTRGDFATPEYIATETGSMLMYFSSCSNTCIYAATQSKFREEIKKLMVIPWTLILTLVKKKQRKEDIFLS